MTVVLADAETGQLDDIVNLDDHPIDRLDQPEGKALIDACRAQLADHGCLTLSGFLRHEGLAEAQRTLTSLAPLARFMTEQSSVYSRTNSEAELTPDDPRAMRFDRTVGHLTRDQIPPDCAVSRLYASPAFKAFVARVVGVDRVFEYADPLAGLITTIVPPGGTLPWHYDTNEFVVSIMTQAPEEGGSFDFCPNLRRPGDENLEGLGRVLRGEAPELINTRNLQPGDLQIFLGRYSLHRVAPVGGSRDRHVAVLSYADRPGVIGPVDRTRAVYGRVTEAHLVAEQFGGLSADGLIL